MGYRVASTITMATVAIATFTMATTEAAITPPPPSPHPHPFPEASRCSQPMGGARGESGRAHTMGGANEGGISSMGGASEASGRTQMMGGAKRGDPSHGRSHWMGSHQ